MYIGRRQDGTIYGAWTSKQQQDKDHKGMEEVVDDHPDLIEFMRSKPMPITTIRQKFALLGIDIEELKTELTK